MNNFTKALMLHVLIGTLTLSSLGIVYSAWNTSKTPSDTLLADDWNDLVSYTVPSTAIMAFNSGSCPNGWSAYTAANGRSIVGVGTLGSESYTLGDTGGSAFHTLTESEMPSHNHGATSTLRGFSGGGTQTSPVGNLLSGAISDTPYGSGTGFGAIGNMHTDSIITTTDNVGGGQAHENRSPYLALLYCQKD